MQLENKWPINISVNCASMMCGT